MSEQYFETKETKNYKHIYAFEDMENKTGKYELIKIDKKNKKIIITAREASFASKVILEDFLELPTEFNYWGKIKFGVTYYLTKFLKEHDFSSCTISKDKKSKILKTKLILNYKDIQDLKNGLSLIVSKGKSEKNDFVQSKLSDMFPSSFCKNKLSYVGTKKALLLQSLDQSIIKELTEKDIEKIGDYYSDVIKSRYKSASHKLKLITKTKLDVDSVAVDHIIDEFQQKLKNNVSEAKWGEFLQKNLFLLDSKYVAPIKELNLVLASTRKVDFGLVDTSGFLDIFEIKKSTTPLLSKKMDRGNYYFHSELTKALAQAEKYLYHAEKKATQLQEDIKRQFDHAVNIIKPRAILLVGNSMELDDDKKKEDFRILRQAFKNIEIVLYDELLDRLKQQKDKIYRL